MFTSQSRLLLLTILGTGYHLNAVTRLSRERRTRVSEKVVESLKDVSVSVQPFVFHPGVYLRYQGRDRG